MKTKDIIQSLVGTRKIIVEDIAWESGGKDLVIKVHPTKGEQGRCGRCRQKSPAYDGGRGRRRWRAMDLGSNKVYVEADAPRVRCKDHGVIVAAVPWALHNSRFCMNFEEQIAWMVDNTSRSATSELMRVEWHTVDDIYGRVSRNPTKASAQTGA